MATKFTDLAADASVQGSDEFLIRNASDGVFAKTTADKIKNFIGLVSGAWGSITGTLSSQTDLQDALNLKAPLASPALTGNPTAPTQTAGDNSTKIATTQYVDNAAPVIPDASDTVKGITKLSLAPVSATNPISVGDNDSRNSDARTPTAHAATHTDGTDDIQDADATQKGLLTAADWTTFNNKANALGFTPEDVANKQTDLTASATKYPTVDAVISGLDTKTNKLIVAERKTANYTLELSDADKLVEMNLAGVNDLIVPPNSTVPFSIGTKIKVAQYGVGRTIIVKGAGVEIRSDEGKLNIAHEYF